MRAPRAGPRGALALALALGLVLARARAGAGAQAAAAGGRYGPQSGPYAVRGFAEVAVGGESPHPALLVRPEPGSAEGVADPLTWPVLIFAHGMCGSPELYSDSLRVAASWGYVVIANVDQVTCDLDLGGDDLVSAAAGSIPAFRRSSNSSLMVSNLASEVGWLSSELDGEADVERVAVVGHSMGGAAVINLAAALSSRLPGLIKAVVAIAPWNGATPSPSEVVGQLDAPLLLFCSMGDHVCPCQGPAFKHFSNRVTRWAANNFILRVLFPTYRGGIAWKGGVEAIYRNAPPQSGGFFASGSEAKKANATASKILVRVARDVGHLTIAGAGTGGQMRDLSSRFSSAWGSFAAAFSDPSQPGGAQDTAEEVIIPTWGYSMAFLNSVLGVPGAPAGLPPRAEGESVQDALQSLVASAAADPGVRSVSSSIAGRTEEWAGL